jgi:hypothetical protein
MLKRKNYNEIFSLIFKWIKALKQQDSYIYKAQINVQGTKKQKLIIEEQKLEVEDK